MEKSKCFTSETSASVIIVKCFHFCALQSRIPAHHSPNNLRWMCNYSCPVFAWCCVQVLVIFCPSSECYGCNGRQCPEGFLSGPSTGGLLLHRRTRTHTHGHTHMDTWHKPLQVKYLRVKNRSANPTPNRDTRTFTLSQIHTHTQFYSFSHTSG